MTEPNNTGDPDGQAVMPRWQAVVMIVAGVLVVALVATFVLVRNSRSEPEAGPPPPAAEGPERPRPQQSDPSASESAAEPTPQVGDFPFEVVLVDAGQMDADMAAVVWASFEYMKLRHERDYNKPYPGYDVAAEVAYSAGFLEKQATSKARDAEHPRSRDVEVYDSRNRAAGGLTQTMSVHDAYLTDQINQIVYTVDVRSSDGQSDMQEVSYWLTMTECQSNEHGWCVSEYEDDAPD